MVGLGWMVRGDFLQMVFVEIQNKIACSITQRCHLRISKILGPKACKIQNILTKKVFQFHPYSDVFCWHVFFFSFFTKVHRGNIYKISTGKGVEKLNFHQNRGVEKLKWNRTMHRMYHEWSQGYWFSTVPWEQQSHGDILMLHLGRLKVNLSQVGFFLVKCGLKYVLLWRFTGLWKCGGSSTTKIGVFRI